MVAQNGMPNADAGVLLDASAITKTISRIAHEIIERTSDLDLVLLGIPSRGVPLANRIAQRISEIQGVNIPVGSIDITMFRDDLRLRPPRPLAQTSIPPGGIEGKLVVLVDDVLFSGRSVRAALDAISEIGRPAVVQLAVLVDRGHRQLPIRADYVGKNIPTALKESVKVKLTEIDQIDQVLISKADSS